MAEEEGGDLGGFFGFVFGEEGFEEGEKGVACVFELVVGDFLEERDESDGGKGFEEEFPVFGIAGLEGMGGEGCKEAVEEIWVFEVGYGLKDGLEGFVVTPAGVSDVALVAFFDGVDHGFCEDGESDVRGLVFGKREEFFAGFIEVVLCEERFFVVGVPENDDGVVIPVVHGAARVSGVAFGFFFVGIAGADCFLGENLVGVDGPAAEGEGAVFGSAPVIEGEGFFVDFAHCFFDVLATA